jgi:mycothiol synthase
VTAPHWRRGLSPAERDAVRALVADAERADGVAPVGEQVLRELSGDGGEHLLALDADGAVAGYLFLTVGTAELVVHPAARRRGVGTALVHAAVERRPGVRFWAHGTLPGALALAATMNLRPVRELIQMRRPLSDIPEHSAPEGISLRAYRGSRDHPELLRVNNAAFAWHPEQGGWTEADITGRLGEPWFDPEGLFLALDDRSGALCGFHWTKVHDESMGEVYVLAVDPAAQGRGLGTALTAAGLHHLGRRLGSQPAASVILYAESDNTAAIRTYEALGFRRSGVDTAFGTE